MTLPVHGQALTDWLAAVAQIPPCNGPLAVNEAVDEPEREYLSGRDSDRRAGLEENASERQWEASCR